ncbi:MAG TPA: Mur ligase family protein [Candidatus Saccharimonadia bacterium]|nr:Mur ligase family protein [Candidatus Saccharimonadia bacterium]
MKGHLYFIGITGHAIRGLALAARDNGYEVSGLDETGAPPGSDWLDERDIRWSRQFEPAQLHDVTAVIVTGAHVSDEYPAVVEARRRAIPIKSWAQWAGEFAADKRVLAVAGTHGKTTTTSLITWLLEAAGRRPDFLIGIKPFNFDSSVRLSDAPVLVIEGDEYRASNLEPQAKLEYYHPNVLVLTSVEHDHPDMYPDLQSVIDRFSSVVAALSGDGRLVVWNGSETALQVAAKASCEVVTYGLKDGDYSARDVGYLPAGLEFDVHHDGRLLGRLAVPMYGRHNVLNALAATVVALGEGLTFAEIMAGAVGFKGAYRRFNVLTPAGAPITVIDDYAHHPTEVAATIEAVKLHFAGQRLLVVYRPHTYSRTKALLAEYRASFGQADLVFMADVEAARESAADRTVSGADIVAGLGEQAVYEPDRARLADRVVAAARPGDVVLCMTVSGYDRIANELAERLGATTGEAAA